MRFLLVYSILNDAYLKTLMQAQPGFQYRQASVLAGYEFWYGRFTVQAHYAWNFISPGFNFYVRHYHEFQRYSLLYRLKNGLTLGVGVRADRATTKGFHFTNRLDALIRKLLHNQCS